MAKNKIKLYLIIIILLLSGCGEQLPFSFSGNGDKEIRFETYGRYTAYAVIDYVGNGNFSAEITDQDGSIVALLASCTERCERHKVFVFSGSNKYKLNVKSNGKWVISFTYYKGDRD